jgi:hypothetical protein
MIINGQQSTRLYFSKLMDKELKDLAEKRYGQQEFVNTAFELAVEGKWFDLQHVIQHDMAKAILADYSVKLGRGYLNLQVFNDYWEEVIEIGWKTFCKRTGISREKIRTTLKKLHNEI